MTPGPFRFESFTLDTADRRLLHGGTTVELNARYFDALALMVREAGSLVTKDRFMDEVWSGITVTDEALTQCIRTLRIISSLKRRQAPASTRCVPSCSL